MADDGTGTKPGRQDYGWGLVACVAGLMLLGTVIGGVAGLFADGPSVGWVAALMVNLLFWFLITAGAWRRTTWSSPPSRA